MKLPKPLALALCASLLLPPQAALGAPAIAAAGDIACPSNTATATTCHQRQTSELLVDGGLSAVLPLGDNQYESASLSEFSSYYGPSWGHVKPITFPSVGNHEYKTSGAAAYFDYFGTAAGPRGNG